MEGHRSGYVALVGEPNVGKSTLMNALLGRKLSIVTRKPQTTRHRVLGILSDEKRQIIFLDTPGVIEPGYGLQKAMMHTVDYAVREADLILFMVDADARDTPGTGAPLRDLGLEKITAEKGRDAPALLVLNKMDLIAQASALPLVEAYTDLRAFEDVVPISARTGFNMEVLLEQIVDRLPQGPAYYPEEMISEHPERFFVAEIIREKIFELYHQEIPYSAQVNITEYQEREKNKDFIDAEIVVNSASHKGILIGKKGSALKKVGMAARKDIEEFVGRRVYLQLHVKVREGWRDSTSYLRSYGYS